MRKNLEKIKIVLKLNSIDELELLNVFFDICKKLEIEQSFFVRGKPIDIDHLFKKVKAQNKLPAEIKLNDFIFRFGLVSDLNHMFILIEEKKVFFSVDSWNMWLFPFVKLSGFVQAWISDVEYDYWQNAYDPLQFKSAGRDYSCLPMKSNGLPYPLEQQVIDISSNPGRWILRNGYVEAVGAFMWLGDEFWKIVGGDEGVRKSRLKGESWLRVQELDYGVTKLTALDQAFVDDSTAQVQNKLREILYF